MIWYIIILILFVIFFLFIKKNYVKYEKFESDNVTVVSGYWKVNNKYGNDKYKEWFKNSLKINQNYIFYCDEKDFDFIKEYRPKDTKFIHYSLDNFYSKQFVKDEWIHPIHVPSKELGMIWNEKIHLIKLAKDQDKKPTDYYIWIDAGISTYRDKPPPSVRLNIYKLPKNKMSYTNVEDIVGGGVLIMPSGIIDDFHDKYYEILKECSGWECGMEQKILAKMLKQYPDLFHKLSDGYGENLVELYKLLSIYKYTAVIIEPREHPALEFVLKNFNEHLSNEWQFVVFHGTKNKEYTEKICQKIFIPDRVKLVNIGVENLTISDYSGMFYKPLLYDNIPTEIFLIFQTDTIICSKHKDLIDKFLEYDYVGAPWNDKNVGNGGLSLRKKSKMLEIVEKCNTHMDGNNYINEDMIFSYGCGVVDLKKPSFDQSKEFSLETVYNDKSFGLHKAYAYLDVDKIREWCPEIIQLKELNI